MRPVTVKRAQRTAIAFVALVAFLGTLYVVAFVAFHNLVLLACWAGVLFVIVWAADIAGDLFHDWWLERQVRQVRKANAEQVIEFPADGVEREAYLPGTAPALVDDLPAIMLEGKACTWLVPMGPHLYDETDECGRPATTWRPQQLRQDDRLWTAVPVCEAHRG